MSDKQRHGAGTLRSGLDKGQRPTSRAAMDLDPRLRPEQGGRVSPTSVAVKQLSTPSPASSLPPSPSTSASPSASPAPSRPFEASDAAPNRRHADDALLESPPTTATTAAVAHSVPSGALPSQQQQPPLPAHQSRPQHEGGGGGSHEPDGGADAKKSRACEACRGLKVRCEPDLDDDGPCKRCRKAGRNCVVTVPTRKRQKKTDSRVSELERKIDALTASLQARVAQPAAASSPRAQHAHAHAYAHHHHQQRPSGEVLGAVWGAADDAASWSTAETQAQSPSTPGLLPQQRQHQQHQQHQQHPQPQRHSILYEPAAGQKRKASELREGSGDGGGGDGRPPPPAAAAATPGPAEADIVDRGLMGMEKAAELFSRYKDCMIRHLPAVVFPPSTSVRELRRTKPYLFLAVMAAASSEMHDLQRVLHKELMQLFAHRIVVAGEKNLELVQALQVAVIWYWPPENFEELKFYQLVHMAAVMALDLGLGRRAPSRRGIPPFSWRESQSRRQPQPDPTSIECRRAWLACHFLAANTAMSLHRPNLIRWSPFMAESLEVLASSPDAAPTDRYFCHMVWTHYMGEEIGVQFCMDDPAAGVSIADARTQYALKALERDLDKYRASVAKEMMQPTLESSFYLLDLYMHELVLHGNTSTEQIQNPDVIRDGMVSAEPLSAAHVKALWAASAACPSSISCASRTPSSC
ncbi:hypothetical protein CDD83_4879 [Cordyceps sp. RAO-2017]|nr:hypothetical protein CDD83_4879 [Cordyceps sp. RAO-2017]